VNLNCHGDKGVAEAAAKAGFQMPKLMPQKQNSVFVWNDYRQWRKVVLSLLGDLVDKSVLNELRRNPPDCFATDKCEWLDKAIQKVKGLSHSDVCTTFLERFPGHYHFVRGFHGCRAESPESYRLDGIRPSSPTALDEIARQIFYQKDAVESAIKDLNEHSYRGLDAGRVSYCIQPELLIEQWGDPLLYGREYLLCIAARIGEEEVLRRHGRAMIVECDVPTMDIPVGYLKCLLGHILREIGEKYCFRPTEKVILFGFEVPHKLEPLNIVDFHFPTRIWNPATRRFES
jgi:hypothetical protein